MGVTGVSFIPFPADMVASLGPRSRRTRLHVESEDCSLLGRGVENFRALDKTQEFQLPDYVVALALFESGGLSQFRHRCKTLGLSHLVCHFEECAANAHLPRTKNRRP